MCRQCWVEYGSHSHTSPEIERAVELIGVIYADNPVGQPLHVQLDDWGIDGEWEPWANHKNRVSPECWNAAVELCEIMKRMYLEDRAAALAHAKGFTA